jgi:hypothetical protein
MMPFTNVGVELTLQISQGLAAPVFLTGAAEFLLLRILAPIFAIFRIMIRLVVTPGPFTPSKQELLTLSCMITR